MNHEGAERMKTLKHKLVMIAASLGMMSTAGLVTVASAQSSQTGTQATEQQASVSDAQLQEFAQARAAVERIQTKYQGRAQDVGSQEEMQKLQAQANDEMVAAVQNTNLSVEQYNNIARLIQTNQKVLDRFMEIAR